MPYKNIEDQRDNQRKLYRAKPEKYRSEEYRKICRDRMRAWRAENPSAAREACRKWSAKSALHRKNFLLKKTYGITLEQRDQMLLDQGSKCAICKSETSGGKDWHVDHCHDTKRVRGILCSHCNLMLGHAKDNPQTLISASEYLKR